MSDSDLENFAGFARLLAKRLKGISPEQIDLSGLVLKGFANKET
jgi:type I restriction enzyme R subunit